MIPSECVGKLGVLRLLAFALPLMCLVTCYMLHGAAQSRSRGTYEVTVDVAPGRPRATTYPAPSPHAANRSMDPFPRSYFAVCAVVKDQPADLREWLYYHHWLGAKTIYLYVSSLTCTRPLTCA
jgi:hypothetical protein